MTLEIKLELTEADLDYFRSRFNKAQQNWPADNWHALTERARSLVARDLAAGSPAFVSTRLRLLARVIAMVEDETWQLPDEIREHVLHLLAYFVDPDGVVSDDIPALGLIDDAIAIELVVRELRHELEAYEEFSAFRDAETKRRIAQGDTTEITTEDWLADRRAALHSRMRERRQYEPQGWHYTTF